MKSTMDELKQIVTNIAVSQNLSGMPIMMTSLQTPINSVATVQPNPDLSCMGLPRSADRLTKSAPSKYQAANDENNGGMQFFTPQQISKCKTTPLNINHQPIKASKHGGRTSGVEIPYWIPLMFKLPNDMILDEIEAAIAAYIFGKNKTGDKSGKEILVKCGWGNGVRATLKTLSPKTFMDQEVLNLPVSDLTFKERSMTDYSAHGFLPTHFSQYALGWHTKPHTLMRFYQKDYMGKVELLRKIFFLSMTKANIGTC